MSRFFWFVELSFAVVALLLLAICAYNVVGPQSTTVGILAGSALGVSGVSAWSCERWRRRYERERREVATMMGVELN